MSDTPIGDAAELAAMRIVAEQLHGKPSRDWWWRRIPVKPYELLLLAIAVFCILAVT